MRKSVTENPAAKKYEQIVNIILAISIINLLVYIFTLYFTSYGIFRDELYYIACANRPAFGYVDQPPLSIWILAAWKFLLGDSLFVIRLLPAFISSIRIFILGLFTFRLGGGRSAVIISTVTFMLTPIFLGMTTIYSMNVFDFFFWILTAYIFLQILESSNNKLWYTLGIVIGLGLLNKTSMLWLGAGVFAGTIFTPLREDLKTKYPYIAALIALLIFSPYIIWNLFHDFAHLEFMRNAAAHKYGGLTPVSFILDMILILNPFSFFIWIPGLIFYFFNRNARIFRPLGYIWLVTFVILFINWHSKAEYLAPAFQILFAGGAVMIVKWNARIPRLKYAIVIPVIVLNLILAPLARPLLPIKSFLDFQSALVLKAPNNEGHETELPQFYADMFGWEDLAKNVYNVYQSLPEEEKRRTVIYCNNYGEAGALEYFGKKYKLPKVICPHNNYWYWWPENLNAANVIIIGGNIEEHLQSLEQVEAAGVHKTKYAMPYENNLTLFIGRGLKVSLRQIMLSNKIFI
ncbi:MAG: glycosyltransferase family 39 protein [Ignavibacteria bacterium]|nr:glycosyltransferase family 39 protein [Ignavibacteria bacterium]